MNAGFYQFNPVFGKKNKNLYQVANVLEGIGADLMVLPEFFATGYQFITMDEVAYLAEEVPGGGDNSVSCGSVKKTRNVYSGRTSGKARKSFL